MSINKLNNKSVFLIGLLVLLSLSACSSAPSLQSSQQILQLDSSDIAQYWVAKDKLIDWRNSLPKELQSSSTASAAQYKASFVVNSSGQMTQLEVINSVTGELLEQAALTEVSSQEFYPTVQNSALQAVRISTSFSL